MGKLFCLMGPSSSGKDTVYKRIMHKQAGRLDKIIPYTTRPLRDGEKDGIQYHFTDEETFCRLKVSGKIIEDRRYDTFYGTWRYFTVNDGQIDLKQHSYLIIGTLESYRKFCDYFGKDKIIPLYIELDPGIRLQRAIDREKSREVSGYEEMCRRFLADSEDFSEENIRNAGITRRFDNTQLDSCVKEMSSYIDANL